MNFIFYPLNSVNNTDWFLNVVLTLHPCDKPYVFMIYYPSLYIA